MLHTFLLAPFLLIAPNDGQRAYVKGADYGPCGTLALYCVAKLQGLDSVTLPVVSELLGPPDSEARHSFAELAEAAQDLGLKPVAVSIVRGEIPSLPTPFVAHMRYSNALQQMHFITVLHCSDEGVLILDPPHPTKRIKWESFSDAFTNQALCFVDDGAEGSAFVAALPSPFEGESLRWLCFTNLVLVIAYVAHRVARRSSNVASGTGLQNRRLRLPWLLGGATCVAGAFIAVRASGVVQALTAPKLHVERE